MVFVKGAMFDQCLHITSSIPVLSPINICDNVDQYPGACFNICANVDQYPGACFNKKLLTKS